MKKEILQAIDEGLITPAKAKKGIKSNSLVPISRIPESERVAIRRKAFLDHIKKYQTQAVEDIKNHLLSLVPKALAIKDQILSDHRESIWLRDRVASDILDRTTPKPQQDVNIKGAIITAQYSKEELERILQERLLRMLEAEEQPKEITNESSS